jgi:aminopeptidase N
MRCCYLVYFLVFPFRVWPQLPNFIQPETDILHYHFRLVLSDKHDSLQGHATIQLRFVRPVPFPVKLDLIERQADGRGMQVTQVTHNGKPVSFFHRNHKLVIPLPDTLRISQLHQFDIFYAGIPADGLIISRNKFGDRTFFGDNWPNRARHWLPVEDHPSDKATCRFTVTTPSAYQVVSNGLRVEERLTTEGNRQTVWEEKVPIPTKVMVIGVARFAFEVSDTVAGKEVQSWAFPQDATKAFVDYAPASRVLRYYSKMVGPYAYEKLANVQSKTQFGGMENAGCIFYNEEAIVGKPDLKEERLVAHEIAHQWFGNCVSEQDWAHIWLSEGFATYFSALYIREAYGQKAFEELMSQDKLQVFQFASRAWDKTVVDSLEIELINLLNPNSYEKGSWILHMLRQETGEVFFWQGIRRYYQRFQNGNATTADFKKTMEETSGKDLSWFFHQWLYLPGYPRLRGSWHYNVHTKEVKIRLRQVQKGPVFRLPLELDLITGSSHTQQVVMDKQEQEFIVPSPQAPRSVVPDPRHLLLFDSAPFVRE